jgi:PHD/YefM family antitoxin component YafN of YafNO toxin-antitoxin module
MNKKRKADKVMSATDARSELESILTNINKNKIVVLTKYRKPVAAIVSIEIYEKLTQIKP